MSQLSRLPGKEAEVEAVLSRVRLNRLQSAKPIDTLMLLGQALERCGKFPDSAAAFEKVHSLLNRPNVDQRLFPRFALAHVQLCRMLLASGRTQDALQAGNYGVRQFHNSYQMIDAFGLIQSKAGVEFDTIRQYYAEHRRNMVGWPDFYRHSAERAFGATLAWLDFRHRVRSRTLEVPKRRIDVATFLAEHADTK